MDALNRGARIAYFSMEIGLGPEIPTYSGGLGVLAGDTIKSAADLSVPMVAVTLLSRRGYFNQELTPDGWQVEHPVDWNPARFMTLLPQRVTVTVEGRTVRVQAWKYDVRSLTGGTVSVLFLDTDLEQTPRRTGRSRTSFTEATHATGSSRRWCWGWGASGCCTRSGWPLRSTT